MTGTCGARAGIAVAITIMAAAALVAQSPQGTAVTLGGRQFRIADWGYTYWSGNREIYGANTYKDKTKPTANLSIVVEGGESDGWWTTEWTNIDPSAVGKSCADDERIVGDLAKLAGFAVEKIVIGQCKSTWMAIGNKALRTSGGIEFRRTTPVIPPRPKLPSRGSNTTPSPQGTVRFAPLGSGTAAATGVRPAPPAPPADTLSVPVTSTQQLAEIAKREQLNSEQAAFAARQVAENQAAKAAFDKATADRAATIAAQQAKQQRKEREYQAAMAKWRADVEACRSGDLARCTP